MRRRRGRAGGGQAHGLCAGQRRPVPREVTTGLTDGRVTEITGGELKEGEAVIVGVAGQNNGQGQRGGSSSAARASFS